MVRNPVAGMGEAVARRSMLRHDGDEIVWETWSQLADRVGLGNSLLHPSGSTDRPLISKHIAAGSLLMSGRHLQHGDETQPFRNMEVFTNCSTAATSAIKFLLLMNGSGVGRCYDDELMLVNWRNMPKIRVVLSKDHPDYEGVCRTMGYTPRDGEFGGWMTPEEAQIRMRHENASYFLMPDDREGWAKALEEVEGYAYKGHFRDMTLYIDFSLLRRKNAPIKGMQNRPASGPIPLMEVFEQLATLRNTSEGEYEPWLQTMLVDHYFASVVVVGGARRASRIGVKHWKQVGIFKFITIKQRGDLWSSNNSVALDQDYYDALGDKFHPDHEHALAVGRAICEASYYGNQAKNGEAKGEPGTVNVHKLTAKNEGLDAYREDDFIGYDKYHLGPIFKDLYRALADAVLRHLYQYIVNPCGEIVLFILGAYCVIADLVPLHCKDVDELIEVAQVAVRALIRTNMMPCLYQTEVRRTNRVGVALTGIHEWAWVAYGLTFYDLLDPVKSKYFWRDLARVKRAIEAEAIRYSLEVGMVVPHTNTTIKPAGTTSKVYLLTEGAHLPGDLFILRWVLYHEDDAKVTDLVAKGYPVVKVKYQASHVRVGFPTAMAITKLMPLDQIVTASQADPESQYEWVRLLEKYWLQGVDEEGNPLTTNTGNQVSYTLKIDPKKVGYDDYSRILMEQQGTVRSMSLMPYEPGGYEYQPEEPVSFEKYTELMSQIKDDEMKQDIDLEALKCAGGACPII